MLTGLKSAICVVVYRKERKSMLWVEEHGLRLEAARAIDAGIRRIRKAVEKRGAESHVRCRRLQLGCDVFPGPEGVAIASWYVVDDFRAVQVLRAVKRRHGSFWPFKVDEKLAVVRIGKRGDRQ